jgi:PAS domain S-box-containing protein
VLIIDDAPADRVAVRLALGAGGFVLREVADAEQGLKLATSSPFDCILVDCLLPDATGLEVLAALRRPDGGLPCAVVALTGAGTADVAAAVIKAGALDYLVKDRLDGDTLRRAIRRAVREFRSIAARRAAERRNARLATIVDASGDAIVSVATDLTVETWNAGAQQLLGYGEVEARGHSIVDLIVQDAAERSAIYGAATRCRTAVLKETTCRHKDGGLVPVETNISPILGGAGEVTGFSVILRDISERRRTADALCRHAERQASLLDITSDLIRATEPGQLSRLMFERIRTALDADICTNFRLAPGGERLTLEFGYGIPPEHLQVVQSLEINHGYCGMAAASGRSVVADKQRIASDPDGALVRCLGATAYACHPLKASDGRLLGTFAVASTTRRSFAEDEVAWLRAVVNFLAQAWERLEAEQDLRVSGERLRLVQEAAGLGSWETDFAGGTPVWSERARKLLGIGPTEPPSLALMLSRVHAEDRPRVKEEIARSLGPHSDHDYHVEFRTVSHNGAVRWLEDQGRVETNSAGAPLRKFGVLRDITGRKNAEEAQARLAAIVTSSADAIISETLDGVVTSWNEAAECVYGYPASEMIGRSIWHLIPADRRLEEETILARVAGNECIDRYDTVRLSKDGRTFDASISASPLRDAKGRVTGICKIITDVTERRRTESRLAEREAQLALFVEHAPAGIAMFDDNMVWLAASRRFLADHQISDNVKVVGASIYEVLPDIPLRWRETHRRVLAGEELSADEDPFLRADGRILWTRWSMKPWRSALPGHIRERRGGHRSRWS